jgi:hypothetical protein
MVPGHWVNAVAGPGALVGKMTGGAQTAPKGCPPPAMDGDGRDEARRRRADWSERASN